MWTTRLTRAATATPGARNVVLSRDDLTFVISLGDWWLMSAAQRLANQALRENDLDFKVSELYGPRSDRRPTWTTDLIATNDGHDVRLLRHGIAVATFNLHEFAALSATEFVVTDAVEVAQGLSQYGNSIEEVDQHFEDEFGEDEDDLDARGNRSPEP